MQCVVFNCSENLDHLVSIRPVTVCLDGVQPGTLYTFETCMYQCSFLWPLQHIVGPG